MFNLKTVALVKLVSKECACFYTFSFETDDGSVANQEGELKGADVEHMGESVKGGFSYKDEEGKTFSVQYTADELGYRPVSLGDI